MVWCAVCGVCRGQAVGGEQAGPFYDDGGRGDDAAPDDSSNERQRHGLPQHHDREALQAFAGEMRWHDRT